MFTGRQFRNILRDPTFRAHVKWVVVDEVHLVSVWEDAFRKSYAKLETIRHALGKKPWFGCTATLNEYTFERICANGGFRGKNYPANENLPERHNPSRVREVGNVASERGKN